jgi:hypothetical protein
VSTTWRSNIIHLVLARLPDAPGRHQGHFAVPRAEVHSRCRRQPGARNAIHLRRAREKMGIHGNSTCQISLDGATGWMIGQPNKGLNAMFVMMNAARLGVGMQSLGLTEVAYQNAVATPKSACRCAASPAPRRPSRRPTRSSCIPTCGACCLPPRPTPRAGGRFPPSSPCMIDRELNHPDEAVRKDAADMVALLTPIVKAFMTDNGWIATSEAMQVHGGHGYITGTGIEQYVRDARINMIYEGTNTIQSLDLLGRKILMDNGAKLKKFGALVQALVEENGTDEAMSEFITPLADLGDKVSKLTMEIGMKAFQNQDEVGAAAVPYLRVVGHLVYSYFFARMAKIALERQDSGDTFYKAKLATARFYFARLAARDRHADPPGACRRQVAARSRS